jgi:hypothetical protein
MRTFLFKEEEIDLYRNSTGEGKRCFAMLLLFVVVVLGKQTEVAKRDRIYNQILPEKVKYVEGGLIEIK